MSDLSEEQADELLAIAQGLMRTLTVEAGVFCAKHGKFDHRDINKARLALLEIALEGSLICYFEEQERVPLMRGISHNVQTVLRLRQNTEKRQRFDA
jgi:hypothetical protein